ncbi:MAG: DASH complex subunit ask1, partial [Candelina submexicana]
MSRPSTSSTRNLSLTEELEKLEQSITLTLQEIDHNFSRAHRIVTTSILPIVEQYAEHSKAVWEGSKFWKQFFEASANVSLSGYEELATDDTTTTGDETHTTTDEDAYATNDTTITSLTQQSHSYDDSQENSFSIDNAHSTPRAPSHAPKPQKTPTTTTLAPSIASHPSPYETLKREIHGPPTSPSPSSLPSTPAAQQAALPDMSMTPSHASSPFAPTSHHLPSTNTRKGADPLLHRVLDKNYRLQATPHKTARLPATNTTSTASKQTPRAGRKWRESLDLDSSPADPLPPPPQLNEDIFSSPIRRGGGGVRTPG